MVYLFAYSFSIFPLSGIKSYSTKHLLIKILSHLGYRIGHREDYYSIIRLHHSITNGNKRLITTHHTTDYHIVRQTQILNHRLRGWLVGLDDKLQHFGLATHQATYRLNIGRHRKAKDI